MSDSLSRILWVLFLMMVTRLQGQQADTWGYVRPKTDSVCTANPDLEILIPFTSTQNSNFRNGNNFEHDIKGKTFTCSLTTMKCNNGQEEYKIKKVAQYGYAAKGDDNQSVLKFVPYPAHVQNQIRKGDKFEYVSTGSYWGWKYYINPEEMTQKNISASNFAKREIYAISEEARRDRGHVIMFRNKNISQDQYVREYNKNEKLKRTETLILNSSESYCNYRNEYSEWCEKEWETVSKLKEIYGSSIRIVHRRTPNTPEFDFLSHEPNETIGELHLENMGDVDGGRNLNFEQWNKLPKTEKEQYEQNLKEKIARAYNLNSADIYIKSYTKGCVAATWATGKDIPPAQQAQAAANLRGQFKQFEAAKIHAALYRPEFNINDFDTEGHKDFENENGTFQIGGLTYTQPQGWVRMGFRVLGKYDSDAWLTPFDTPGNWARGYHGMGNTGGDGLDITSKIWNSSGLRLNPKGVNAYGLGVYWSDDPEYGYEGHSTIYGASYDVKLMVAVEPNSWHNGATGNYHCPDPKDIRVYGILLREQ